MIERNSYLNKLINSENNGMVKVITGIRRCGKSYLLDPIFKSYLLNKGINKDHIIKIELDKQENIKYHHNPDLFNEFIKSKIIDDDMYYFILDEIELVDNFEFILNGLLYLENVDIYVTGSNSKFLSSDIITEFRGRGYQIHVLPLSFNEYLNATSKDKNIAFNEYIRYGGMPATIKLKENEDKEKYLKDLFEYTYFKDIVNRYNIKRVDILDSLINIISSSIGSLTNPQKIYDTFKSNGEKEISINTINSYLKYIEDSFLIEKSLRYDVKGRKYISTPNKYYFSDIGLRNARLNFRQNEESHIIENIIYNELIFRGFNVDVGIVEIRNKNRRISTEIDFVCNKGFNKYYIQSVRSIDTIEKQLQETRPLNQINDNFKKVIIVKDSTLPWKTEDGILVINLLDFLLDPNTLAI